MVRRRKKKGKPLISSPPKPVRERQVNSLHYRIIFLLILLVSTFLFANAISDSDFFWHLATGRLMESAMSIPHSDPFSYTAEGHKWVTHEWLFETVIWQVYKLGSFEAISVLNILMLLGIILIPIYRYRNSHVDPIWLLIIGITGSLIMLERSEPRPHVLSSLFFILFLIILENHVKNKSWRVWLLPPLTLFWANWHSGFVFGLILIAYYFAWDLIGRKKHPTDPAKISFASRNSLGLCLAASAAAAVVNPNFLDAYLYPLWLGKFYSEVMLKITAISELVPLTLDRVPAFWLSVLIVLFGLIFSFRKISWRQAIIVIALILACIYRMRFTELYVPVFLAFVPGMFQMSLDNFAKFVPSRAWKIGYTSMTAIACFYTGFLLSYWHHGPPSLGIHQTAFPDSTADWIVRNNPDGNMYNSLGLGGYLAWRFYPDRKIFLDGRIDVFEDLFRKVADGADLLRDYDIDYAMFEPSLPGAPFGREEWAIVEFDGKSVLVLKRDGAASDLIAQNEYFILGPYNPTETLKNIQNESLEMRDRLVYEVERMLANNDNPRVRATSIGVYIMLGEEYYPVARRMLDESLEEDPWYSRYWHMSAYFDFVTGDYARAEKTLRSFLFWWPRASYARHLLAQVILAEGDTSAAIRIWQRMIRMNEADQEVYISLAMAYHQIGRDSEARAELENYFRMTGNRRPDPSSDAAALQRELTSR